MNPSVISFVQEISAVRLKMCFNPYAEDCDKFDYKGMHLERHNRLIKIINYCTENQETDIWIGRDLGHRGGRRTGVALMDDFTLKDYCGRFGINNFPIERDWLPVKEQTATCVSQAMSGLDDNILTWNVFPFHPFNEGSDFSNRCHSTWERNIGLAILEKLLKMVAVRHIICIGADASKAVAKLGYVGKSVRHPSYGGKAEFLSGIRKIYSQPSTPLQLNLDLSR